MVVTLQMRPDNTQVDRQREIKYFAMCVFFEYVIANSVWSVIYAIQLVRANRKKKNKCKNLIVLIVAILLNYKLYSISYSKLDCISKSKINNLNHKGINKRYQINILTQVTIVFVCMISFERISAAFLWTIFFCLFEVFYFIILIGNVKSICRIQT